MQAWTHTIHVNNVEEVAWANMVDFNPHVKNLEDVVCANMQELHPNDKNAEFAEFVGMLFRHVLVYR